MSDITDVEDQRAEGLKAWGWVSYLLHLIVAVGAVIRAHSPARRCSSLRWSSTW